MPLQQTPSASNKARDQLLRVLIPSVVGVTVTGVWISAWPNAAVAFAREDSALAWISSTLLVCCALISLVKVREGEPPKTTLVLALGFGVAALDERFMLHERLKEWLLFGLYAGDLDAMGVRGDLPLLLYPLALGAVIRWRWPQCTVVARRFFASTMTFGLFALGIDLAAHGAEWLALEEVLEIAAETTLLLALLERPAPG